MTTPPTHAHAAAALETWRRGASFLLVGALWGCSNAVIKQATETGSRSSSSSSRKEKQAQTGVWTGLKALVDSKAALAFLVNQSGSLVFYYLLGTSDISLAVPLCNSLTFVFTALTSHLLGERVDDPLRAAAGVVLVLLGVSLCVASK